MSCRIPYDKLKSLFTRSLQYDRATYRFYKNYIKSVMSMPIPDEAKVHAIWFGGLSYNDALNYERDIVTEGLPSAISNLVFTSLNDPNADFSELLNGIRDILGEEVKAGKSTAPISDKKADIKRRRQEELISAVTTPISYKEFANTKPESVIVNDFEAYEYDKYLKKYVVRGAASSTDTSLESIAAREESAKDIEFFKDKSLKLDTVNFFWSERLTGRSPMTKLTSYKKRTKQGRIDERVGDKLVEINAKYDAELARELYKEMKAGKLVTDMTPAEQQVADKYITEELRKSVDAELAALEGAAPTEKKTLKAKYIGKLIYATPGAGKTTLSQSVDNIMDTDVMMIEEMKSRHPDFTMEPGESPQQFIFRYVKTHDHKGSINATILQQARELNENGVTVVTGTMAFIKDADVVVTVPASNPRVQSRFGNAQIANEFSQKEAQEIQNYNKRSTVIQTNLENLLLESMTDVPEGKSMVDLLKDSLKKLQTASVDDSLSVFQEFTSLLDDITELTNDQKLAAYNKFLEILSRKPDSLNRTVIVASIQVRKNELAVEDAPTGLIDFGRIPGIGLDMYSIRVHETGEVFEAIRLGDAYYKMNPRYDGSNPEVLEVYTTQPQDSINALYSQVPNASVSDALGKNARVDQTVVTNGIFFEDVRIYPLGVVEDEKLDNRTGNQRISYNLAPGISLIDQVQVIADRRRVNLNKQRLENLEKKGFDVRYENTLHPNQINYLRQNPNGVVVSFLKPKVRFDLIISDMEGVNWDYINGLDNLGFVYGDGTSRLVNWDDASDLALLGETLTYRRYNQAAETLEYQYVTPAEIESMRQAVFKLRDFKNEIDELMGDSDTMVVPRDLLLQYYNISNNFLDIEFKKAEEGKKIIQAKTPLANIVSQLIPTGSTIKATIARTRFGRVVPDDVKTIDLVGIIYKNQSTGQINFAQSIPDGYVLVDDNLNPITNPYETLFGEVGLNMQNLANDLSTFKYNYFYLVKYRDKWSARPMQRNAPMSEVPEIINFVSTLSALVQNRPAYSPEPDAKNMLVQMIQEFNNNGWGFNLQYGISPNIDYLRMWNNEPVYGIRLRAQPNYPFADQFNEKDITLEFSFDYRDMERYLNTIYKELGIDIPEFKSVAERVEFGEQLEAKLKLAIENGTLSLPAKQAYDNIVNNYKEARINLFQQLEKVIEKHGKDVEKGETPYIKNNSELIYSLFQNLDGTNLKLRSNFKSQDPIDRYKTFENDLNEGSRKQLNIVNANPRVNTGATIKVNTPVLTGVPTPSVDDEAKAAPVKQIKIGKRKLFSIVDSLKSLRRVSDAAVAAEIDEMRSKLGDNLKDVVESDLTNLDVNGIALGYAENGVITLNKNLRVGGIVYHEAFHIVFRVSLTDEKRRQYLDTVAKITGGIKSDDRGKYINVRGKKVYLNKFRLDRRYSGVADDIIADYIYEEYMADGFRDYKLNNKEPKNAVLKFFYRLMDSIVKFFTSKEYRKAKDSLNELYQDIDNGRYASVVGDVYTAPRAYELINIPSSIIEDKTNEFATGYTPVDTKTYNQLIDRITSELLIRSRDITPNDAESFDKIYNEVTAQLIGYYNIRNFVAADDPRFQEAFDKYEPSWRAMRFMMGALHRPEFNETFTLINESSDAGFDNFLLNKEVDGAADYSFSIYETVKNDVNRLYSSVGISEDVTDEEEESARENSEDNADQDYQDSNDESNVGERYDDEGITSFKPFDGTKEFQKILRFVKYEVEDTDLGFSYIKMVDSRNVINIIRKITANVPKENIVRALLGEIEQMRVRLNTLQNSGILDELGYIPSNYANLLDQYNTLKAVYDTLDEQAGLNTQLRVTRKSGEAFYNMFHDVFYYAQKDVTAVTINTNWEGNVATGMRSEGPSPIRNNYTVRNLIQNNDISIVTRNFRETVDIVLQNIEILPIPYTELVELIKTYGYDIPVNASEFMNVVSDIYRLTSLGKLDIPFNVIEFSVAAAVKKEMGNKSSFVDDIINRDLKLYNSNKYLDIPAFLSGYQKLLESYNKTGIESKLDQLVDLYKPAAAYQVKYEPGLTGTTVLNQDGKPISQFVPYVPSIQILADVRRKGFAEALTSIYGSAEWFSDNPWLNIGIANTAFDATRTDIRAKFEDTVRTFLENMDITIAGGLYQEFEGAQLKSTFRRLGDKGYTLSVLGMFANRFAVKGNHGQNVVMFNRPITQLEATSTQFNVTALYTNFNGENANSAILNRFKAILKQEFNRIQREWSSRNDPTKKLLDKYNSITLPDGTVITDDTTSDTKLRAYTFNYLGDFFSYNEDTDKLRGILIDAAKEGKTFEETLALFPAEAEILDNELLEYGERNVTDFYEYLNSIDVKYDDLPSRVTKGKTKEDVNPITIYQKVTEDGKETYELDIDETKKGRDAFVRDFVYNYWFNGFFVNQLFDGDLAVGIKGFVDYFKRQKSGVAAGTNYRNVNINEIDDVTSTAVFQSFKGYLNPDNATAPVSTTNTGGNKVSISDGQAWTTLMRRIKKYRKDGLLSPELEALMLKMRYAALDPNELQKLIDNDLVLSSGKPVAAHPYFYLKDSEHVINRTDVSNVSNPAEVARLYAILDGIDFNNFGLNDNPEALYKDTIRQIHSFFTPVKGREFLHHMLNSMEFHRVDVVFDQEVTKKASVAPLVVDPGLLDQGILEGHPVMMRPGSTTGINSVEDGYINLTYSKQDIPNAFFYDQVGTKGIKDETTDAIQKKLLLPAQLDPKEFPLVQSISDKQNSIAKARLAYLDRLFKTNKPASMIAKAIKSGLLSQGAGENLLKYYKTNEEGKNEFNLNLPILGKTPLYYFFSVFNKNLFGPKVAGKKFFHVSNLGYKIVVDENDNPVPRSLLTAFPSEYENYATRYPTVKEEYDANGELTRIVVEVIVPREIASNPDDVEFFEQLYTVFLASRIPTEDKRSLLVAKVVDTIDASYGNSIIVPSQVHKWAGSDLDIDALYAETYDYYRTVRGELVKYGDYRVYRDAYGLTDPEAKFVEYLHFVAEDPFLKDLVDAETKKQVNVLGHRFLSIQNMAGEFGPKLASFFENTTSPELQRMNIQIEINELRNEQREYRDENKILKEVLRRSTSREEKQILRDQIRRNDQEQLGLLYRIDSLENLVKNRFSWDEIKKTNDLNTLMTRMVTVINVLKDNGLPATLSEFNTFVRVNGNPVTPLLQNEILDDKMNLLGDPRVYERFVKTADAEVYLNAYKTDTTLVSEISEFKGVNESNPFLFQTVARVRALNNGSKDMLGANASQNKGAALLASSKIELGSSYVHKFKYNGKQIQTNLPVDNSVQLVGGAIGVSADDGKNQYLGPLRLSRYNSALVNALYIYGYPPQFARLLSSVDLIANAITNFRLNDDPSYSRSRGFRMSFGRSLLNTLGAYLTEGQPYQKELAEKKLLKPNPDKKNLYDIDLSKVTIEYSDVSGEPVTGDQPSNFNITVRYGRNQILDDRLASVVLMAFYSNMLEVGNVISFKVSTITNVYKSIKPDFDSLSKIKEAAEYLKNDNPVFKNSDKIFKDNPSLTTLVENGIDMMNDISKQVLMDQTDLFKAITNMFAYDKNISRDEVVTQLKSILGFSTLNKYVEKKVSEMDMDDLSKEDRFLLILNDAFTLNDQGAPAFWTKNQATADLKFLKSRYPDNLFLQALTPKPAVYGGKTNVDVITSIVGSKVSPERQDNLINDFYQLMYDNDQSVYEAAVRLAVHGMVKDAGISKREGYLKLLAPELFGFLSGRLDEVQQGLYKIDTTSRNKVETYLGGLDELFRKIYNLPKDSKLERGVDSQRVLQSILTKLVSTITQNVQSNKSLAMSFFPGGDGMFPGKYSDVGFSNFKRIVDMMLPKNKDLVYKYDGRKFEPNNNLSYTKGSGLRASKTRFELWKADAKGELFFDLSNTIPELQSETYKILKGQGIYPTKAGSYAFPLYQVNNFEGGQLFMLQEIDGKPFNQEFFKNLYDAYKSNEEFEYLLRGKTAKYALVQRQGVDRILPNAFTNKVATEIKKQVEAPRVSAAERRLGILPLPEGVRFINTSSNVAVASKELSEELSGGVWRYQGMNLTMTKGIRYATNSSNRGKLFVNGKTATQSQMEEFANKIGFINFTAMQADPRMNSWLNPTKGSNQMWVIPYTAESSTPGEIVDVSRPVVTPAQATLVTTQTGEQIYAQLVAQTGNKTKTPNIIIDDVAGRKASTQRGIVAYRTRKNNFLEAFEKDRTIGNPWNERGYGLYKSSSIKDAVIQFTNWLTGEAHTDKLQDYRKAIIDNLDNLRGRKIIYYRELNEPSHATALDYLVNKYDWSKSTVPTAPTQPTVTNEMTSILLGLGEKNFNNVLERYKTEEGIDDIYIVDTNSYDEEDGYDDTTKLRFNDLQKYLTFKNYIDDPIYLDYPNIDDFQSINLDQLLARLAPFIAEVNPNLVYKGLQEIEFPTTPTGEYQIVNQTSSVKEGTFIYIPDKKGKIVDYKVVKVTGDQITVRNQNTGEEKTFNEAEYRKTFNQPVNVGFSVVGEKGLAEVYNTGLTTIDGKNIYSLEINLFDDANKGKGLGKDIYIAAIQELSNRNGVLTPGNVVETNKVWDSFERDGLTKTVQTTTGQSIIIYDDSTIVEGMTLKEYADKTSARFVDVKQVLRKDDIEYFNDRVNDLIADRLKYAIFAEEDLNNRQYLPFINKLKENGFMQVEGMPWVFSKNGVNPKEEYAKLTTQPLAPTTNDWKNIDNNSQNPLEC